MKWLILISGLWLMAVAGCGLREREAELERKMKEVAQKEQELLLREKSLQLKERELNEREKLYDSTSGGMATDSLSLLHPQLSGTWFVRMTCIEATCPGSAVGDIKTEQWEISYQSGAVIVKATSNNNLSRIYAGRYSGNSLELSAQQDTTAIQPTAAMVVRLQETKENEMEGQREITREEGCRIVYDLELKKQLGT